jgi:aminoglycoside 6'-N-acetyltransferase
MLSQLYSFRPATARDLPRLRRWLHAPEVKRWWGDPRHEFELLRVDLDEPRMRMRIVSFSGRPFAYAQDYEVHAGRRRTLSICRKERARSTVSSACPR